MSSWRDDGRSNYMNSQEWKQKRIKRIEMDGGCCVLCGRKKGLVVHHVTYDNYRNENMEDLITLCRSCHYRVHNPQQLNPYSKKDPLYVEVSVLNWYGGRDIYPVSEPFGVEYILANTEYITDTHYHLVTLESICDILNMISEEKGKVFSYILRNIDKKNVLEKTMQEISDGTGIDAGAVKETVNMLVDYGYAVKTENGFMINPRLVHKGDSTEEIKVFKEYESKEA